MQSDLLKAALQARIIIILGQKDTGKTTLTRRLVNALFRRGYSVGIIDADVGQSDIGPPATIGFGIVTAELKDLNEAALQHFYFVGSISPKGHLLQMVVGTRKILDKALACGIQKILIDTTGLVAGQLGRVLKTYKIEAVNPDLIICLQKDRECEHLLNAYTAFAKPAILRCRPEKQCLEKPPAARQTHRETSFQRYFSRAVDITCSLTDIGIFDSPLFSGRPLSSEEMHLLANELTEENASSDNTILWAEDMGRELYLVSSRPLRYHQFQQIKTAFPKIAYVENVTSEELSNLLLGLLDKNGEYSALGILRAIDFQNKTATIRTPANPQEIKGIKFSTCKMLNY